MLADAPGILDTVSHHKAELKPSYFPVLSPSRRVPVGSGTIIASINLKGADTRFIASFDSCETRALSVVENRVRCAVPPRVTDHVTVGPLVAL